jgi:putative heme transporter
VDRIPWRRVAGIGVGLAVVVGTFVFVLPRIADYGDTWRVVKALSWAQIGLLAGATALNLATSDLRCRRRCRGSATGRPSC